MPAIIRRITTGAVYDPHHERAMKENFCGAQRMKNKIERARNHYNEHFYHYVCFKTLFNNGMGVHQYRPHLSCTMANRSAANG